MLALVLARLPGAGALVGGRAAGGWARHFSTDEVPVGEPVWSTKELVRGGEGEQTVTQEEIEKLAELSCIELGGKGGVGAEAVTRDINDLLHFVRAIDELDTTGVEPMWTPLEEGHGLRMRDDARVDGGGQGGEVMDAGTAMSLAARARPPFYEVPLTERPPDEGEGGKGP